MGEDEEDDKVKKIRAPPGVDFPNPGFPMAVFAAAIAAEQSETLGPAAHVAPSVVRTIKAVLLRNIATSLLEGGWAGGESLAIRSGTTFQVVLACTSVR